MISRWLVKLILGIAIAGFLVIELGSPVVAHISLDSSAHTAADEASREYAHSKNFELAQAAAQKEADEVGAKVEQFDIDEQGTVRVTLFKQAKSYLLHNFEPTRSWYDVRAKASAAPSP